MERRPVIYLSGKKRFWGQGETDGNMCQKACKLVMGTDFFSAVVPAPFGAVGIVSDGESVSRIAFLPGCAGEKEGKDALTAAACRQIAAYLADPAVRLDFPVANTGTVFRRRVREAMRQIPAGQTRTYGKVARHPGSDRGLWAGPVLPIPWFCIIPVTALWRQAAWAALRGKAERMGFFFVSSAGFWRMKVRHDGFFKSVVD